MIIHDLDVDRPRRTVPRVTAPPYRIPVRAP